MRICYQSFVDAGHSYARCCLPSFIWGADALPETAAVRTSKHRRCAWLMTIIGFILFVSNNLMPAIRPQFSHLSVRRRRLHKLFTFMKCWQRELLLQMKTETSVVFTRDRQALSKLKTQYFQSAYLASPSAHSQCAWFSSETSAPYKSLTYLLTTFTIHLHFLHASRFNFDSYETESS